MCLKKAEDKETVTEEIKRANFKEEVRGLFDIAHNRSLELQQHSQAKIFVNYQKKPLQKGNYKELLQLTIFFLGEIPPPSPKRAVPVAFRKPGAIHHARWLAKANYSLKMFLFRDQCLSEAEITGLREVCIYVVLIHVKTWFSAPLAASAPRNDLQLLKDLINFRKIINRASVLALNKMQNHLWYLNEKVVPLAFFDKEVSVECKKDMVEAIKEDRINSVNVNGLDVANSEIIESLTLDRLINKNSINFFTT